MAPVMKRKGEKVGTSYEERGRKLAQVMKRKGKKVGTSYEEEGGKSWHQL